MAKKRKYPRADSFIKDINTTLDFTARSEDPAVIQAIKYSEDLVLKGTDLSREGLDDLLLQPNLKDFCLEIMYKVQKSEIKVTGNKLEIVEALRSLHILKKGTSFCADWDSLPSVKACAFDPVTFPKGSFNISFRKYRDGKVVYSPFLLVVLNSVSQREVADKPYAFLVFSLIVMNPKKGVNTPKTTFGFEYIPALGRNKVYAMPTSLCKGCEKRNSVRVSEGVGNPSEIWGEDLERCLSSGRLHSDCKCRTGVEGLGVETLLGLAVTACKAMQERGTSTTNTGEGSLWIVDKDREKLKASVGVSEQPVYSLVSLNAAKTINRGSKEHQGGTHNSPVEHVRQGHERKLRSGKVVFVRETTVNRGKGKAIYKI